ncbi:hypothetical protein MAR_004611, partial [Mya arenaria]
FIYLCLVTDCPNGYICKSSKLLHNHGVMIKTQASLNSFHLLFNSVFPCWGYIGTFLCCQALATFNSLASELVVAVRFWPRFALPVIKCFCLALTMFKFWQHFRAMPVDYWCCQALA